MISTTTCSICGIVSVASAIPGFGSESGRRMLDRSAATPRLHARARRYHVASGAQPTTCEAPTEAARGSLAATLNQQIATRAPSDVRTRGIATQS